MIVMSYALQAYLATEPELQRERRRFIFIFLIQGRLSDIKTKKERADLKLNILLLSDYGLNGVEKTTKIVLDDYLEFNHTQYIIQRGGSCVLVPFALRVN
mgnify:CR=1 FL=1